MAWRYEISANSCPVRRENPVSIFRAQRDVGNEEGGPGPRETERDAGGRISLQEIG